MKPTHLSDMLKRISPLPYEAKKKCATCGKPFPHYTKRKYCSRACLYGRKRGPMTVEERFWKRVNKGPHPKGCWLWTGSTQRYGYGLFFANGSKVTASVWSYKHHKGPIPKDCEVCHTCDNPGCVNPAHLIAATHRENMAMVKPKWRSGGDRAKINWETAQLIRAKSASGISRRKLANEFGVSPGTVRALLRFETWKVSTHLLGSYKQSQRGVYRVYGAAFVPVEVEMCLEAENPNDAIIKALSQFALNKRKYIVDNSYDDGAVFDWHPTAELKEALAAAENVTL